MAELLALSPRGDGGTSWQQGPWCARLLLFLLSHCPAHPLGYLARLPPSARSWGRAGGGRHDHCYLLKTYYVLAPDSMALL